MLKIKRELTDDREYTVSNLKDIDERALQYEYDRLRQEALENIRELKNDSYFNDVQAVRREDNFTSKASTYTKPQLIMKILEADKFLTNEHNNLRSLQANEEKAIETLNLRGFKAISHENYKEFISFLEATDKVALSVLRYYVDNITGVRKGKDKDTRLRLFSKAVKNNVSNEDLIKSFNALSRRNISIIDFEKNFNYYIKHMDEITTLPTYSDDQHRGRVIGIKKLKRLFPEKR